MNNSSKSYQDLARDINALAYCIFNKKKDILNTLGSVESRDKDADLEDALTRMLCNRVYYALFTYFVEKFGISKTTACNKHERISKELEKKPQYKVLFQTFKELQRLRVWADYHTTTRSEKTDWVKTLSDVYKIINQK